MDIKNNDIPTAREEAFNAKKVVKELEFDVMKDRVRVDIPEANAVIFVHKNKDPKKAKAKFLERRKAAMLLT